MIWNACVMRKFLGEFLEAWQNRDFEEWLNYYLLDDIECYSEMKGNR